MSGPQRRPPRRRARAGRADGAPRDHGRLLLLLPPVREEGPAHPAALALVGEHGLVLPRVNKDS